MVWQFVCCRQVYLWLMENKFHCSIDKPQHKVLTVSSISTTTFLRFQSRKSCNRKLMFSDSFIPKTNGKIDESLSKIIGINARPARPSVDVFSADDTRTLWKTIHFVASLVNIHQNTIRIIVQWKSLRCSHLQLHGLDLLEWFNQMRCTHKISHILQMRNKIGIKK